MYLIKNNKVSISVRNLVEFVFREGDIDNRIGGMSDIKYMQEGIKMHKKIQRSMGDKYAAEVPLRMEKELKSDSQEYFLVIEGRADGIIADFDADDEGNKIPVSDVCIDEIKTIQKDVNKVKEPVYVHKAQALCYAYIFLKQHELEKINIQVTYCNPDTEEIKRFNEQFSRQKLSEWFDELILKFKRWTDFIFEHKYKRIESISNLKFPFEYRNGQKHLVAGVYKSIENKDNLFIQASTGVGKTVSTIYPCVQAMGKEYAEKIFYLTSKTITRTVAHDTFNILRKQGLVFSSIILTARDKICILEERDCNPEKCERAKGHFDRVNDAVYDIITNEENIDRDNIIKYAKKHNVCPFEFSLDISYWCDGIICDYNYVFDPKVALKRFFGNGSKSDYIFLVDEAHNLVDRAREMYSAVLIKEDFLNVKKIVKEYDKALYNSLEKCNSKLLSYKRESSGLNEIEMIGEFVLSLERCFSRMQKFFDNHKNFPDGKEILKLFFDIKHFLDMYDCIDDKSVIYTNFTEKGDFFIKIFCIDPSGNLAQKINMGRSTVFFSATLLPVNYFKEMLTGNSDDLAVYAESSFDPDKRRIVIGKDVSSRYTRRNYNGYLKICSYIYEMSASCKGNYMVFFPSYQYMDNIKQIFMTQYRCKEIEVDAEFDKESNIEIDEEVDMEISLKNYDSIKLDGDKYNNDISIICQKSEMSEKEREVFLSVFENNTEQKCLIGLCVMGGIFSEGIDLKEKSLIGAAVVGTGIPMISSERNLLRKYFDDNGKNGYEYAYIYPGMIKVLQSVGRVIRTEKDSGVILLLDDRFTEKNYEMLYPREWNLVYPANMTNIKNILDDFWKKRVQ